MSSQMEPDPHFLSFSLRNVYPYINLAADMEADYTAQLKPRIGRILRSKLAKIIIILACFVVFTYTIYLYKPPGDLKLEHLHLKPTSDSDIKFVNVDWSRYAYVQYVTNEAYLCNSVMLFEILHRLGSKADRLMMYPSTMRPDAASDNLQSRLLLKAQNEYGVKLTPIQIEHRDGGDSTWSDSYTKLLAFNQTQYDRVLSLDSDSTVLKPMDELFLLPDCPVAMPRAYWLEQPFLSSQLVLIKPSAVEFTRVKRAIDIAAGSDFDMDILNHIYGKDCLIIPHRRYNILTAEFRPKESHSKYLGNGYETWNPDKVLSEASFLHFSDWPMPKPWLTASEDVKNKQIPPCQIDLAGNEDCRSRDIWLGFYSDFKNRRKDVCTVDVSKLKTISEETRPRNPYEYIGDDV